MGPPAVDWVQEGLGGGTPGQDWCVKECEGASRWVVHFHHCCWQCGAAMMTTGDTYHCKACGCGGGPGCTTPSGPEFSPELARTSRHPLRGTEVTALRKPGGRAQDITHEAVPHHLRGRSVTRPR